MILLRVSQKMAMFLIFLGWLLMLGVDFCCKIVGLVLDPKSSKGFNEMLHVVYEQL